MARSTVATLAADTCPSRCKAASWGSCGSSFSPSMELRGPTAAAARTRDAASPGETCSIRTRNWVMLEKQWLPGRSLASASAIKP